MPTHSHQRKIRYSFLSFLLFDSHIKWTKLYIHSLHISLRSGFQLFCDELIRFAVISLLSFSFRSVFIFLLSYIHLSTCSLLVHVIAILGICSNFSLACQSQKHIHLHFNCVLEIKWIAKPCSVHMVIKILLIFYQQIFLANWELTLSKAVPFDLLENHLYFR